MSDLIRKGALVAGNQHTFEELPDLNEEEKAALRLEHTNKWKQTKTLYALVICCSMAAVVQGCVVVLCLAENRLTYPMHEQARPVTHQRCKHFLPRSVSE